ncbi:MULTISPECIES: hypothetical protein [Kamptonema]|uniref:hypothetical protein n=1 Tax=Kamptonema TaxID=1501433 RepID=UPI0001DAD188|nr:MULTISPECIES: hypothetical protein [Kamptonema]CBN55163.1 exported hypothetical protein [Kamptonema sp. PCC 6506]
MKKSEKKKKCGLRTLKKSNQKRLPITNYTPTGTANLSIIAGSIAIPNPSVTPQP